MDDQVVAFGTRHIWPGNPPQQLLTSPPFCLGTNVVGTKVYGLRSLESFQAEDVLIGCRPTASYLFKNKVDLISTLLDARIVQNAPRRSRRLSLKMPLWTHSKVPQRENSNTQWLYPKLPPIPSNSALFEGTAILSGVWDHSGRSGVHSFNPSMHRKNECTTDEHSTARESPQCTVRVACRMNSCRWRWRRRWRPQLNHPFIYFRSAGPRLKTA